MFSSPLFQTMYACRDTTGTVANLSLITSSIVCKKAAENLTALVLDVKYGEGSFSQKRGQAETLANSLISVCR